MKISHEVRNEFYSKIDIKNIDNAMKQKSNEFNKLGGHIYHKADNLS